LAQATPLVINSLQDLNVLHAREMAGMMSRRMERAEQAIKMTTNLGASELVRSSFLRFLLDGPRDIDAECGYPAWLTPDHYRAMYDREGVARRVVECEPKESWKLKPEVYEDEDPENDTEFEKAWKDLVKKWNLFMWLKRIDILSGIGQYGILLIGLDDGMDLKEPVEGFNDDGTVNEKKAGDLNIIYFRAFSEEVVFVKNREVDPTNPRYGLPKTYTIQFRDFPNWGIQAGEIVARDVHWSRVVHLADNRKMSEVYGTPRMQEVWNRLYDLRKIYSAGGEAFWKGAFPGFAFEMNPELADQGITIDEETMRKEFEKFQSGMQRYIAVTGLTTKTVPPQVVDPTGNVEVELKAIAIAKAIPYRILFGSEESHLASDEDTKAWNGRLKDRQDDYLTPLVLRPFVDRMIDYGILPRPEEYHVEWPDLNTPKELDKAQVALAKTNAISSYAMGNAPQIMPPREFYTHIMGFSTEEAEAIMKAAAEWSQDGGEGDDEEMTQDDLNPKDEEEEPGEDEEDQSGGGDPGGLGGESPASMANALAQDNLSRSTTTPPPGKKNKKAKEVDFDRVNLPELNSAGARVGR
jgi:hypothetical protein